MSVTIAATSAATTATASAQSMAGAATAGTVSSSQALPVATTSSSISAAQKIEVIRKLASIMIPQVLNQSEIVDEFATPIYTGLSAATSKSFSSLESTASNSKGNLGTNSPVRTNSSPTTIVPDYLDDKQLLPLAGTDSKMDNNQLPQLDKNAPQNHFLPTNETEPPEIRQILDQYYQAPTIEDQVKDGLQQIVVKRDLIDDKVVINGQNKTAICLIEERIIDVKYLEYGNLSDAISQIRHGNLPTIRQIYFAILDLTDLATFQIFRPYLLKYKLENATVRLRQISADFEQKTLQSQLPEVSSERYSEKFNCSETETLLSDVVIFSPKNPSRSAKYLLNSWSFVYSDVVVIILSRTHAMAALLTEAICSGEKVVSSLII